MIYVTGDIHGDQVLWHKRIDSFLKAGDTILIPGDFGVGFFNGRFWSEELFFDYLANKEYSICFCSGNHENFDKLSRYQISEWNGGRVHFIRPNVIHLMRGELYNISGKTLFAFGGGYSIDKERRIPGVSWWPQEMPSEEEYRNGSEHLKQCGYKVDYIITHSAPADTVDYMSRLGKVRSILAEERPLADYLTEVEEKSQFGKWFFGHYHIDEELPKNQYVIFNAIRELDSGKLVEMRNRQ